MSLRKTLFLFYLFFKEYLFIREKEHVKENLPTVGSLPRWPQLPGLGQAKAGARSSTHLAWLGPKHWDHLLLLLPGHYYRTGSEAEQQGIHADTLMGCCHGNLLFYQLCHNTGPGIALV